MAFMLMHSAVVFAHARVDDQKLKEWVLNQRIKQQVATTLLETVNGHLAMLAKAASKHGLVVMADTATDMLCTATVSAPGARSCSQHAAASHAQGAKHSHCRRAVSIWQPGTLGSLQAAA
jgi:hypothetical protein